MLKTLENLNPDKVRALLDATAIEFVPDPAREFPESAATGDKELREQLVKEARQKLRIVPGDESSSARAKILDLVVKEIGNYFLKRAEVESIKTRLGVQGALRPDLYQVRFGNSFENSERIGIRKNHIMDAIISPDAVEHLFPHKAGDYSNLSFYAKTIGEIGNPNIFSLLVPAKREGYSLLVDKAWRVYHSDVDLTKAQRPLDVLHAFVDVYGIPFRIGASAPSKFFLYAEVPLAGNHSATEIVTVDDYKGEPFEFSSALRIAESKVIEVSIVYFINTKKYGADLDKHGIHDLSQWLAQAAERNKSHGHNAHPSKLIFGLLTFA